jgi:hypothetical protein
VAALDTASSASTLERLSAFSAATVAT